MSICPHQKALICTSGWISTFPSSILKPSFPMHSIHGRRNLFTRLMLRISIFPLAKIIQWAPSQINDCRHQVSHFELEGSQLPVSSSLEVISAIFRRLRPPSTWRWWRRMKITEAIILYDTSRPDHIAMGEGPLPRSMSHSISLSWGTLLLH